MKLLAITVLLLYGCTSKSTNHVSYKSQLIASCTYDKQCLETRDLICKADTVKQISRTETPHPSGNPSLTRFTYIFECDFK